MATLMLAEKEQLRLLRRLPDYLALTRGEPTKDTNTTLASYHVAFSAVSARMQRYQRSLMSQTLMGGDTEWLLNQQRRQELLNATEDICHDLCNTMSSGIDPQVKQLAAGVVRLNTMLLTVISGMRITIRPSKRARHDDATVARQWTAWEDILVPPSIFRSTRGSNPAHHQHVRTRRMVGAPLGACSRHRVRSKVGRQRAVVPQAVRLQTSLRCSTAIEQRFPHRRPRAAALFVPPSHIRLPLTKMRKPLGIVYAVEARHRRVVALSGLQHVALMTTYLVFPLLLLQATKAPTEVAAAVVSLTLLTMAIGTLLQTCRLGPIGSGFLCQPVPSVLYFVPSMAAATHGGIAAVYGMTLAAGLFEVTIARILQRTRKFFPPEIAGLVVLLAGISTGIIGLRTALGAGDFGSAPRPGDADVALFTLAIMAALNVWGPGLLRIFCVLIGIAAGTALAWLLGPSVVPGNSAMAHASAAALAASSWFAIPGLGHIAWSFDPALVLPFAVAAVAASLKATGNITIGQKASDAEWVRPDMRSISHGIAADGLATAVAGVLGTLGVSSATGAIGLASATGVMSRRIGYAIAVLLMLIALVPGLSVLLYMLPRPVLGAALMFAATFIIVNGLQIMAARLIDARKTLVIGLALVVAIGFEVYPGMLGAAERHRLPSARVQLGTVRWRSTACSGSGCARRVRMTVGPGDVAATR
jgi:NCS2 family nucleobase:cation symporter-2